MLFYRCKGKVGVVCPAHHRRLRYDGIGHLVSDGCNLGSALIEHEQPDNLCGLGRRRYHARELCHNLGEREWLTVRVSCRELFGCCPVFKRRLARRLGLGCVLLEHVVLMRDLTVEVLDCMDVCLIGIAKNLTNEVIGHALGAAFGKDREHLVIGELKLSASGSHELSPSVSETRVSRRSALFSLPPLDNYYYALVAMVWQELIYKYGGIMETAGRWPSFFRFSN